MAQSRCDHDLEYGQEYDDIVNQVIRARCLECNYQSYSIFQPTDKYRFKRKDEVLMIQNNLDGAIRSFRAWCEGKEGFDELELKEAIQQHVEYVIRAKYTDLTSKYEEYDGKDGIRTELFDDESEETTGEKLALLANFVADKTANEIYGEQLKRAGLEDS